MEFSPRLHFANDSLRAVPGSRAPGAKDCAECGSADCGLELATLRFRDFGPPRAPLSLADSEFPRKAARNAP
eukprot:15445331-Alexandrium_andersonii.AAC.1